MQIFRRLLIGNNENVTKYAEALDTSSSGTKCIPRALMVEGVSRWKDRFKTVSPFHCVAYSREHQWYASAWKLLFLIPCMILLPLSETLIKKTLNDFLELFMTSSWSINGKTFYSRIMTSLGALRLLVNHRRKHLLPAWWKWGLVERCHSTDESSP